MKQLTAREQTVLDLINRNKGIADDEMLLLERYWIEIDHWDDTKSLYWNLQRSIHPESLSRIRRVLHERGLITYSKDAEEKRYTAFKSEQERHGSHYERMAEIVKPKKRYEEVRIQGVWVMREVME